MKAPEPVNRCENLLRVIEPTSFDSYTFRGAAFLETYLPTRLSEVRWTSRLIASTVFPVPGPPSMINTLGFSADANLAAATADS
ncbi:hypothetical protein D3C72_1790980 [compost metagenome]